MAIDWEDMVGAPCVAVFGEADPWPYLPADGSASYTVIPVFDEGYREITLIDATSPTSDATPVIGVNDGQFKAPPLQGDRTQNPITGTWYIVKESRPDSHGVTKLMLNLTDPPT